MRIGITCYPTAGGSGINQESDGLVYKNVLAMYSHIHALGTPQWAPGLIDAAKKYRRDQA